MKAASVALNNLLLTGKFVRAELYTLTLFGGGVLRYTTGQLDIVVDGTTWTARGPRIDDPSGEGAKGHWSLGLDVGHWQVRVMPRAYDPFTGVTFPDLINGTHWTKAAQEGALSGARLQVDRAYLAAWPTDGSLITEVAATGILPVFVGRIAEVDVGMGYVVITANDYRELLTVQVPRHVYQSGCRHTLFDAGCALNPAGFAVNGAAGVGSTRAVMIAALGYADDYFALGRLVMTSGLNDTFSRQVKVSTNAFLKLSSPLPFAVAPGDTFTVYPGCDLQSDTCTNKFSNLLNYGGQEFIPAAVTAA